MTPLSELKVGETALIKTIETSPQVSTRFVEMGLSLDSPIQLLNKLPFGGNFVVLSEHGKYTIRRGVAKQIQVDPIVQ